MRQTMYLRNWNCIFKIARKDESIIGRSEMKIVNDVIVFVNLDRNGIKIYLEFFVFEIL